MTSANKEEALRLLRSEDQDEVDKGFRRLYSDYFPMVERLVMENSGGKEDARDVFQDTVITFYQQLRKDGRSLQCSVKTYIYALARNIWLYRLRQNRREVELKDSHSPVALETGVLDALIMDERTLLASKLLGELKEDCRRVLIFYYYDRLSMAEISRRMGYSSEQVAKNKKLRCLKALREKALKYDFLFRS